METSDVNNIEIKEVISEPVPSAGKGVPSDANTRVNPMELMMQLQAPTTMLLCRIRILKSYQLYLSRSDRREP
jgi:hypothetical protein